MGEAAGAALEGEARGGGQYQRGEERAAAGRTFAQMGEEAGLEAMLHPRPGRAVKPVRQGAFRALFGLGLFPGRDPDDAIITQMPDHPAAALGPRCLEGDMEAAEIMEQHPPVPHRHPHQTAPYDRPGQLHAAGL